MKGQSTHYALGRQAKGSALIAVMVLTTIMALAVASLLSYGLNSRRQVARMQVYQDELGAAEQAIDAMVGQVRYFALNKPRQVGGTIQNFDAAVLGIKPPSISGFAVSHTSVTPVNNTFEYTTITDPADQWLGYTTLRLTYKIHAEAKSTANTALRISHAGVALERQVQIQQIPLYAYAIFYGNNLEIANGAPMDVTGKVHTNGNCYLSPQSPLSLYRAVTIAGSCLTGIFDPASGRTDASQDLLITTNGLGSPAGGATLKNANGAIASSINGGWLDSRYTKWVSESNKDWNGYLRDQAHGVPTIGLPIPSSSNPHLLVERPVNSGSNADSDSIKDLKFANKANISITNFDATNPPTTAIAKNGSTIQLTWPANGTTQTVLSSKRIYSGREGKYINIVDVDMERLIARNAYYNDNIIGDGIIFISPNKPTNGEESAVRLSNATTVPTNVQGGLTIATDGPLYTRGDVNTKGYTKPEDRPVLLLASDAVNILSNNFKDVFKSDSTGNYTKDANGNYIKAAATKGTYSIDTANNYDDIYKTLDDNSKQRNKNAVTTTTNAIFLTGNVPSVKIGSTGYYSGGAENFFRYMENWGNITHTFNGSMLNLYASNVAIGNWKNAVYSAPKRVWSWDPTLAGVVPPPGMPTFFEFKLLDWKIVKTTGS